MMKVLERFSQIGGIREYIALPPGERAIYDEYTKYAIAEEAKTPVIRISK